MEDQYDDYAHELGFAPNPTTPPDEAAAERERRLWEAKRARILEGFIPERKLREMEIPKRQPIVEGLIHAGETGLLVGRPKVGKSRLVMQLATALTRGYPFLNNRIDTKRRVVLLDLENGQATVRERVDGMIPAPAEYDEDLVVYAPELMSENRFTLSDDTGVEILSQAMTMTAAEVLIVDTWRLLAQAPDENRVEHVLLALNRLDRVRESNPDLSVLLIHHLRKRDLQAPVSLRADPYTWVEGVSGHHGLVGHVDFCWGLDREVDAKGNETIVFGGVSRNAASSCVLLEEDTETLMFKPAEAVKQSDIFTGKEQALWENVVADGSGTFTDLLAVCRTSDRKSLASALRKAKAQGWVVKTPGHNGVWRVTAQGGNSQEEGGET